MFDPDRLVWTSREEVTSLLLSALHPATATRALDLCQDLAPPSAAPALLAIARARDRPYWDRVYALRAHVGLGAPLPDTVLESFFAEWFFSPQRGAGGGPVAPGVFELRDLLAAVRTPAHERLAMDWLARSSPDVRAEALVESVISHEPPAPQTTAWLADEWLAREGAGCSAENNDAVRCHVFPERQPTLERRSEAWFDALWELDLPPAEIFAAQGTHHLRWKLRRAIADRSAQLAGKTFTLDAERVASRYRRAVAVLRAWCDGAYFLAGLLRGVALHPALRADLTRELLAREPARAVALTAERFDAEGNRLALRAVLQSLSAAGPSGVPVEAARALAWRTLRAVGDEGARYLAIGAIEAIADPPPEWPATLVELSRRAEPLVRVRALASRALRGERDAEAQLARAAVDEPRVEVRAEAIRALGALPSAGDHLALFDRALAADHATFGDDQIDRPATEQAALAVACLDGDAAMTVLLRRAFGSLTEAALAVIKAGLRAGADGTRITREERRRRVAEEEGWRLAAWSPLGASRYGRPGE